MDDRALIQELEHGAADPDGDRWCAHCRRWVVTRGMTGALRFLAHHGAGECQVWGASRPGHLGGAAAEINQIDAEVRRLVARRGAVEELLRREGQGVDPGAAGVVEPPVE